MSKMYSSRGGMGKSDRNFELLLLYDMPPFVGGCAVDVGELMTSGFNCIVVVVVVVVAGNVSFKIDACGGDGGRRGGVVVVVAE
jgi:hypothetical protein